MRPLKKRKVERIKIKDDPEEIRRIKSLEALMKRTLCSFAPPEGLSDRSEIANANRSAGNTIFGGRTLLIRHAELQKDEIQQHPCLETVQAPDLNYQMICIASDSPYNITTKRIQAGPNKGSVMFTVEPQPRPREVFRFLDLPAEVRNTVYKHLLLGPQAILRINKITKAQPKQMFLKGSGIQTQLLRVNKQLNQEASHFLFGMNMLQFDNTKTAFDFIWTVMGPQRVQGHWGKKTRLPAVTLPIRNLAITDRWIHGSGLRLARLMRCAPHLQALTLSQKVVGTYFDQPEGILYQLTWPSWRSTAQNLDFLIGLLRVKDFNPLTGTLFSCQPERLQADLDNTIADALLLAGVRF